MEATLPISLDQIIHEHSVNCPFCGKVISVIIYKWDLLQQMRAQRDFQDRLARHMFECYAKKHPDTEV